MLGSKMRFCFQETVLVVEEEEAPVMKPEPEPEVEMETDSSFPQCIGPECFKQALTDSVYCGTDCILQHAAFTMKTLSGPKVPKPRGRPPKKARPNAKVSHSNMVAEKFREKFRKVWRKGNMFSCWVFSTVSVWF